MLRRLTGAAAVAVLTAFSAAALAGSPGSKAEVDKPVTDFTLRDLMIDLKDGEKPAAAMVTLSSFKGKKPVVLFFMSEKCGTTWRYEKRFGKLMKEYGKQVAFLGIRCSANDTPEGLRKFAESKNFVMPLANDEKGVVTSFFNVRCTPTFALIDKEGVLRYKGSFDDSALESEVMHSYLPDAVKAVMGNQKVAIKSTLAFG